tara:strand:+ start:43 stop:1317 length:1275 start_codon:yes stop_codon:yes gene_type:complete
MAVFVDSNAVGLNDGSNWANAYSTLVLGAAAVLANDTVAMADNHTETNGANTTYSFANGVDLITSTVTGASTITATQALNDQLITQLALADTITFNGTGLNLYGAQVSSSLSITCIGSIITEKCTFDANTGNNNQGNFNVSGNGSSWLSIDDVFDAGPSTNSNVTTFGYPARTILEMIRPAITSVRPVIFALSQGNSLNVDGGDLSGCTSSTLISNDVNSSFDITNTIINALTVTLASNVPSVGSSGIIEAVDSVSSVNRQYRSEALGELFSETSIILDSTNPASTITSNKIVTNSSAESFFRYVRYPIFRSWSDFSTSKAISIEFCQDGTTTSLTDDEIWVEIQYPDDTTAKYLVDTDRASDNQSGVNQATSLAAWAGLSGTNVKQKCSITTTQTGKAGPYQVFMCLAKPSTTIYVNPNDGII